MRSVLLKRVGGALLQATPRHVRVQTKRSWQPNIARQFGWKASGSSVRSFGTSTSAAVLETEPEPHAHEQQDSEKLLLLLEQSIQERQANKAYAYYKQLQSPLPALLTQKLAMALAKRGNKDQAVRAYEVLRSVYHLPGMTPDDYTQLASIYVVDACARHKLIDEALEIYEEAFNAGVMLDLPAFNALIKALVNAKKADQAADILKEVTVDNGIAPMEESYYPLLVSLAKLRDYDLATEMMEHGRSRGIIFSLETYEVLAEHFSRDKSDSESKDAFMEYLNIAADEDHPDDDYFDMSIDDHEDNEDNDNGDNDTDLDNDDDEFDQ